MKYRSLLLLLTLCLAFGAMVAPAAAQGPKWSDEELAGFSEVILTGRVSDMSSANDQSGAIYTYVTVDVGTVLKGWIFEPQIVVKQLGGRVGDVQLVASDQPSFQLGEEVLLFLEVRPRDGSLYTTALWQGKWNIETDVNSERVAIRRTPDVQDRGVLADIRDVRRIAEFAQRLQVLAGPDATRPGAFLNTRPRETPIQGATDYQRAPYTLLGPARWREADSRTPIALDVQAGGQPGLSGGGLTELSRATTAWMNTGASFAWTVGNTGAASRCQSEGAGDGRMRVVFMDPCGEISNSGGTLATGGFYTFGGSQHVVNGQTFSAIASGFLTYNDSSSALQFAQNSGCFQEVAVHEFGHAIGFGHSADSTAIMFASVSFSQCSSGARNLGSDDIALARFVYPGSGGSTTVPGAPTNFTATSSGSNVSLFWGAPSSGGAPTSYFIEAGSSSGGTNLAAFNTGSTATSFSTSGIPAGTYYIRVKGVNSAGTGAASNQAVLVVGGGSGPCTGAPTAPSGLSASVSGLNVTLTWGASGGSPTTYVIEAGSSSGASNILVLETGSTATSLAAVASPGTYYVRVRGKNACGTSSTSNQIVIVVN